MCTSCVVCTLILSLYNWLILKKKNEFFENGEQFFYYLKRMRTKVVELIRC
ncbi:hypothetical protein GLYMA_10G190450v4 [Glycine max]|nr:hypothetical protein GLYMA_10G190450v4 [Glycine max]KAH1139002.1 hypothetical protein GYH30_028452 [Glycine max]